MCMLAWFENIVVYVTLVRDWMCKNIKLNFKAKKSKLTLFEKGGSENIYILNSLKMEKFRLDILEGIINSGMQPWEDYVKRGLLELVD